MRGPAALLSERERSHGEEGRPVSQAGGALGHRSALEGDAASVKPPERI